MGQFEEFVGVVKDRMGTGESSFTPLYHRLQDAIRFTIDEGHLRPDDVLPPERDLAAALSVSRVTIRNAIRSLVEEGLLVQRQGAGTFVSRRIELTMKALTSFSEDVRARGMNPEYKMLDRHTGPALPIEAEMLDLKPGTPVTRLYRVRSANKKPMCIELTCLAATVLPADTPFGDSLYSYLAQKNMRPERAQQRLRAELLDMEHARLLGVPAGAAGLFIEQRSYTAAGRPVEYVQSHYRGDSYDFVAELKM